MSRRERSIRDRIRNNDVTMMRSYLEVDVAEWFSRNEIPFGYEAFTIPSIVGPNREKWEEVVQAVRAIGKGERDEVELPDGEIMDAFDILSLWNEIYDKHRLQDEHISIPPRQSLEGFDKKLMLPDFAIYKDADIKTVEGNFDWGSYDYIVEVSGLYGVGLPEEAEESEWWTWYRVSAVAYKEFMYRLLGMWDRVLWVVPNQPYIEGVTDGIPRPIRDDDHYIIMNTTQSGLELNDLAEAMEITAQSPDAGLSPAITPTMYRRPTTSSGEFERGQITPVEYEYDGIAIENASQNPNVSVLERDFIVYYGELGEVYLHDDTAHVRESQWRGMNMIMLREYVLNSLTTLHDDGIVEGLRRVE